MAFEVPGIPHAYNRASADQARARLVFPEGAYLQGADLNEVQSIEERIRTRIGNMTASNGDRLSGCSIVVDAVAGTVSLDAGMIYIAGDVRPVSARTLVAPMVSDVYVGVRLVTTTVTAEDDPTLLGLEPGSASEGEPGAVRQTEAISWSLAASAEPGPFFAVYLLRDGAVVDQSPPPTLSGIKPMLAEYDRDAHGNYIVSGCQVSALGKSGSDQVFSIAPGVSNIYGFKIARQYALRWTQTEDPDLETVAAEPHTFTGPTGGATTVQLNHTPLASVISAVVVKRQTETVIRGAVAGGTDGLSKSGVVAIESVAQGGATFAPGSWAQSGDAISWAPSGAEPASASSYSVTYLYNAPVVPTATTATSVTLSGGVQGQAILLSYSWKLPRIDVLCLNPAGGVTYVKGISARRGAVAPIVPSNCLHLATVTNDWAAAPKVENDGTYSITFDVMARYFARLIDVISEFNRAEAERDILTRQPVAKDGIFTDTFVDDLFRDQGEPQTAAINDGTLCLAVDTVGVSYLGLAPAYLDFVDEVVVAQDLCTSTSVVNPYAIITRMPAGMTLQPPVDFWTDHQTTWTSPVTQEFTNVTDTVPAGTVTGTSTVNSVISDRVVQSEFLRQIPVAVTIAGFGVGERLSGLTFGGVDVTPAAPPAAGADGTITLTVTVPANVPAGTVLVHASGAGGSYADALYVGAGTIEVETLQQVTLVQRAVRATVVDVTNVTNITNVTNVSNSIRVAGGGDDRMDPLAETFTLPEARHVSAIRVRIAAVGDRSKGLRCQIVRTVNGYPSMDVIAEAFYSMATAQVGDWITFRFPLPVFLDEATTYAFSILTDDTVHALWIAKQGDVVTNPDGSQRFVAAAPYTVGVMFSSSNRQTWTPHNDADLAFEIVAAKFTTSEKVVVLGTVDLAQVSDVLIRGTVEIPTAGCAFRYEVVRADGSVIKVASGQNLNLSEYLTETVVIRAVLDGTEKTSPILYMGTTVVLGRIRSTGTYVTRAFPMGAGVTVYAVVAEHLPTGSAVVVEVDDTTDTWTALTQSKAEVLGDGWIEPIYTLANYTAQAGGRLRLTLSGGPDTRPALARLRGFTV